MTENRLNALLRATRQALRSLLSMVPVMLGVLLLMSLFTQLLPRWLEMGLFGIHPVLDALSGAVAGSISAGQPVISYLVGGELRESGVSLVGITALVVSWVTVALTHLPMEAAVFGWRFSILRNLVAFLSAIIIAFIIAGLAGGA